MRKAAAFGIVLSALIGGRAFGAPPAELQPLEFLIGEWPASGSGRPGHGSGVTVFTRGLQGRVLVRRSYAEYPAASDRPASRHDDLMIIYTVPEAGVRADYFDSEGHVIRYMVRAPGPGQAVFLSTPGDGEPRYRLSYRLDPSGLLKGEFAIAPPADPAAFKTYLSWESRKPSAKPAK